MTVTSIGVDICDIQRIGNLEENQGMRFLQKVFTAQEIEYCAAKISKHASYAARFAAKEALLKALGTGLRDGFLWKDIEINNDELGKPFFKFYGKTAEVISDRHVHLSISHTDRDAIAFVVIEGEPF
jgi:holo-[acyl-carrier protein] synthase